jgi:outer membrane biosynthesis protein TonB
MNDEKAEEGNKQINDEAAKEPEEGNTQMNDEPAEKPEEGNTQMNDEPAEKPEEGNTQMNDEPAEKPEEGNTQMNDEPAEKPEVKTQEVVLQANENTSGQKKDHNPNEQSNEGTQEVTNKPVRVELYHRRIMQLKRLAKNAFFPIKWVSPPRSSEDVMTDSGELE